VLEGKPVILISYSEAYSSSLARPVAEQLAERGLKAILVGDEPLPAGVESSPEAKVSHFFNVADMAVFLATPDDHLAGGSVQTRQNIIEEHRIGLERSHLKTKLLVFKAQDVRLPSNINPVYNALPLDNIDWIVERILRQAREWGLMPLVEIGLQAAVAPQSDRQEGPSAAVGVADADAHNQAIGALEAVGDALDGGEVPVNVLERAELVVSALTAERRGGDVLGVRLANRIFVWRTGLSLRPSERVLLIRTWLQNWRADNTPGVVWLKGLSRREAVELLMTLARAEPDDEVRAQALRVLATSRVTLPVTEARALVQPFLAGQSSTLRQAGLFFVQQRKGPLRVLLDDEQLLASERAEVTRLAAELDLPRYPGRVLERFIADSTVRSVEIRAGLLAAATRLSRSAIIAAIQSGDRDARLFGIALLTPRDDEWTAVLREIVVRDRAPVVRLKALGVLIRLGEQVDDELFALASTKREDDEASAGSLELEYEVALEMYRQRSPSVLTPTITWLASNGPERYQATAMANEGMLPKLRRDLRTDFRRLVDEYRSRMLASQLRQVEATVGRALTDAERVAAVATRDREWSEFDLDGKVGLYLLRRFSRVALCVLAISGRSSDIEFARRFVESSDHDLALATLPLFDRFGTAQDAKRVVGLVDRLHSDEMRLRAGAVALRLAYKKDKLAVLRSLRDIRGLKQWAVAQLGGVDDGSVEALSLLKVEDSETRLAAARVVWEGLHADRREQFLDYYMSDWYYFNVVCWFDRRLYSPSWLHVDSLAELA
jgi:hypothetical protein